MPENSGLPSRADPPGNNNTRTTFLGLTKEVFALVLLFVVTASLALSLLVGFDARRTTEKEADHIARELCDRQAALVDMQLLFLEEHDAIRKQLLAAKIPTHHADPDLLEELERLIQEADCDPSDLEP